MTDRKSVWNKSAILLRENTQYYYVIVSQLGSRNKHFPDPLYDSSQGHTRGANFGVLVWLDESIITIIYVHYARDPLLLVQVRDREARRQQATIERDSIDKQASGRRRDEGRWRSEVFELT